MKERQFTLGYPLDVGRSLGPMSMGAGDPTVDLAVDSVRWATRTPVGAATLELNIDGDDVAARAWGDGADWVLDQAPRLLGSEDDLSGLVAHHSVVADLLRRHRGVRLTRTDRPNEALVRAILAQLVAGKEAKRSFRRLVERHGEPAPGPQGLMVMPAPETLADLPYHEFHPLGIERRRADIIRRSATRAKRIDQLDGDHPAQARAKLQSLPGIGPWTAAMTATAAWGDPDAVPEGDFHLPNIVAWALAGEDRADDARMLELLEPYAGQRGRVAGLLKAGGIKAPRYGARRELRSIEDR